MPTFKDSTGQDWTLTLNVGVAKRVKDRVGVDVFALHTGEAERVFADPILLVNMLYVWCEPQAQSRGVSENAFGESMVGDAIESAALSAMDAVADFFPASRRAVLNGIKTSGQEIARLAIAKASAAVDQVTAQMKQALSISGDSVTN